MLQSLGKTLGQGNIESGYEILTRSRPFKRVARPDEIANAILYLSSDLASFTPGAVQVVDGGVMAKAG
jgi:NAD(P)-dependent dehydrogenase (short-subunit alcohol dehydrogenase family)